MVVYWYAITSDHIPYCFSLLILMLPSRYSLRSRCVESMHDMIDRMNSDKDILLTIASFVRILPSTDQAVFGLLSLQYLTGGIGFFRLGFSAPAAAFATGLVPMLGALLEN